jgi:hypothetical protein
LPVKYEQFKQFDSNAKNKSINFHVSRNGLLNLSRTCGKNKRETLTDYYRAAINKKKSND